MRNDEERLPIKAMEVTKKKTSKRTIYRDFAALSDPNISVSELKRLSENGYPLTQEIARKKLKERDLAATNSR